MFGVIRETLERDGGSMRGEEDFFSVASTTPLVAKGVELDFRIDRAQGVENEKLRYL